MPLNLSPNWVRQKVTITQTDAGGGSDDPALRPTAMNLVHRTTAATVAGVGLALDWTVPDSGATDRTISSVIAEITNATAGALEATLALVVKHQNQDCEVARVRGQTGLDATSVGVSSAIKSYIGGQLWLRGDFLCGDTGKVGIGAAGVAGVQAQITTTADANKALVVKGFSATQSGNLTEWQKSDGTVQTAVAANGRDFVLDTTTGTKLGTGATQKLGFWGHTPVVQPAAYTVTNPTTSRSLDEATATLTQLTNVVGTLIQDLQAIGLLG